MFFDVAGFFKKNCSVYRQIAICDGVVGPKWVILVSCYDIP